MKKKYTTLLCLSCACLLGLIACGNTTDSSNNNSSNDEVEKFKNVVDLTVDYDTTLGEVNYIKSDYEVGDIFKFKVTPNKGHNVVQVTINDERVQLKNNEYKFQIMTKKVKICVVFEKISVDVQDFELVIQPGGTYASIKSYMPDKTNIPHPFYIPETLTVSGKQYIINGILPGAFDRSNVEHIVINKYITEIVYKTFANVNGLKVIEVDNDNPSYTSENDSLLSKDKKTLITVPSDYQNTIYNVPSTVETIAMSAFTNSRSIEEIKMGTNVKVIEEEAFSSMRSLEKSELPTSITYIPPRAYDSCVNLNYVKVPEGVTEIAEQAFRFNPNLYEVILPSTLKVIGKECFERDQQLTKINFNEGLTHIYDSAFGNVLGIKELKTPNSLEYLGDGAFTLCSNLKSVTLNEGLKYLGGEAFILTPYINKIEIPASVETIPYNPVIGSDAKVTLAVGSKHFTMDQGVLYNKEKTKLISVPYSLKPEGLKFNVPSTVNEIGYKAFSMNTYLIDVTLPTSLTKMDRSFMENMVSIVDGATGEYAYNMKISYLGTMAEFDAIDTSGEIWNYKANFKDNLLHCKDGDIVLEPQPGLNMH